MAAAYANIGNTYLSWGNQLRRARAVKIRQDRERKALFFPSEIE
jgi:hypothetical protein